MAIKAELFVLALQYLVIVSVADSTNSSLTRLCTDLCQGPLRNSSVVKERCEEHVILDRCCVNNSAVSPHVNTDVIGIDLSDCGIDHLNNSLQPFTNVVTLVLENNPLKQEDVGEEEFYGLAMMDYLSLPSDLNCPGGNTSWEIENHTLRETVCELQIDQCTVENFTCPDHSYCSPCGPGLKDCLCRQGYFGYKCMKSGHFPTEWFLIGLGSATVVISAFLWITQRRHALNKKRR